MVYSETAREILSAWEAGESQHPIDRALTLLRIGSPAAPRSQLAALSIGERDRRLLGLREQLFGPVVDAFSKCPACAARVEFQFGLDDIRVGAPDNDSLTHAFQSGDWVLHFRLPNSRDLAEAVALSDVETATERLAARCLIEGRHQGSVHSSAIFPPVVVRAWRDKLREFDPQAEVSLQLDCPGCGHRWTQLFDIAAFLWTEVSAEAQRLLREVDCLARAYGWSEMEILALSATRRRAYLELAAS